MWLFKLKNIFQVVLYVIKYLVLCSVILVLLPVRSLFFLICCMYKEWLNNDTKIYLEIIIITHQF